MAYDYAPSRTLTLWGVAIGCFIAGIIATVGALTDWGPAPTSPLSVSDIRSYFVEHGGKEYWRVEMDIESTDNCSTVIVDRSFAPSNGPIWRQQPARSYVNGTGALPYAISIGKGSFVSWHEYAVSRSESGRHVVQVTALDCDAGFAGTAGTWTTAYDWTVR